MNAVLRLKECVYDLAWRELGFEGRVMNAVLGLKDVSFVELMYPVFIACQVELS